MIAFVGVSIYLLCACLLGTFGPRRFVVCANKLVCDKGLAIQLAADTAADFQPASHPKRAVSYFFSPFDSTPTFDGARTQDNEQDDEFGLDEDDERGAGQRARRGGKPLNGKGKKGLKDPW